MLFDHSPTGYAVARVRAGGWRTPYCDSPVSRELFEGQLDVHPSIAPMGAATILLPCRKCRKCRFVRSQRWKRRIEAEATRAERVWFVTLTYRSLPPDGVGQYRDVQLYLKRVRKVVPRFRFLCVAEKGTKNGRFHWHLLIFGGCGVKKTDLRRKWPQGFTHARLASEGALSYVADYSAKSMIRVSASRGFGAAASYVVGGASGCQKEKTTSSPQATLEYPDVPTEGYYCHGLRPFSFIHAQAVTKAQLAFASRESERASAASDLRRPLEHSQSAVEAAFRSLCRFAWREVGCDGSDSAHSLGGYGCGSARVSSALVSAEWLEGSGLRIPVAKDGCEISGVSHRFQFVVSVARSQAKLVAVSGGLSLLHGGPCHGDYLESISRTHFSAGVADSLRASAGRSAGGAVNRGVG